MECILIGVSILVILMVILSPHIRSFLNKWRMKKQIKRDAKGKSDNERAQIAKQKELAQIEKQKAIAIKERYEIRKKEKDKEVSANNKKYMEMYLGKYKNARFRGEVQYIGAYRIPISEHFNHDLNIQGLSFFIDNVKSIQGKGIVEVRHDSFEDNEYDTYPLEIIYGFAILYQELKNKNNTPRKDYSSTYRELYLTIRENSFENINTGIVHNIRFTPYSILDWK